VLAGLLHSFSPYISAIGSPRVSNVPLVILEPRHGMGSCHHALRVA
jgi:hypothetical protein